MITPEQQKLIREKAGLAPEVPSTSDVVNSNLAQSRLTSFTEKVNRKKVDSQSFGEKVLSGTKATLGGIGAGVGGIPLTIEDWIARKLTDKFGSEELKKKMAETPSLQEQFKQEMGGNEHPNLYGAGEIAGEIATLATPVTAIGKAASTGSKLLGAGPKVSKLVQAGTEGAAFTAGMGLTEGKPQSLTDYAINTGLNMVFPIGGMALKSIGETMPSRVINSLIKPLLKDFAYEKNPGESVARLGIVANTFDDLIPKIRAKINEIGQKIGATIEKGKSPEQLDLGQTLKPIDDAIIAANKAPRTNANLIQRLENVKADISSNIADGSLQSAQTLKGLVGDLTKWTGNATDDAAVNKSLKQVYGSIRSKMDSALEKVLTPEQFAEYKQAAQDYGNLMSAENAAIYRDKILERSNLISFGAKNIGLITGLTTAIATGGAAIPAILAGLTGAAIDKAMATPAFKTRLAKLLAKLAPTEVKTFFEKVPTAKSLFDPDELVDLIKETPNKQGGFVANPFSKLTKQDLLEEKSTLENMLKMSGDNKGTVQKNLDEINKLIKEQSDVIKKGEAIVPKIGDSLMQEAKKYKTADEFMNALNVNYENSWKGDKSPDADRLMSLFKGKAFHGTNASDQIISGGYKKNKYFNSGAYFSDTPERAIDYMKGNRSIGNSQDVLVNDLSNLKVKQGEGEIIRKISKGNEEEMVTKLKKQGYDGIKDAYGETLIWNTEKIKTPEKLTSIWKQANQK